MTSNTKIDELFIKVLKEARIKHVFVDGFDKYIVYNEKGDLFVIGFNATTKKYSFGHAPLMMNKYVEFDMPLELMPDYKRLYGFVQMQENLTQEFKTISDFYDSFYAALRQSKKK